LWIAVFLVLGGSCHSAVRFSIGTACRLLLTLGLIETIIDYSLHQVFLMSYSFGLPPQTVLKNGLLVDVERLKLLSINQMLWPVFQELVVVDARFEWYDLRVCQVLV
jgi:hypothetical protein